MSKRVFQCGTNIHGVFLGRKMGTFLYLLGHPNSSITSKKKIVVLDKLKNKQQKPRNINNAVLASKLINYQLIKRD